MDHHIVDAKDRRCGLQDLPTFIDRTVVPALLERLLREHECAV